MTCAQDPHQYPHYAKSAYFPSTSPDLLPSNLFYNPHVCHFSYLSCPCSTSLQTIVEYLSSCWLISLIMMPSSSTYTALLHLYLQQLCMYTTTSLSFICHWTFELLPYMDYCTKVLQQIQVYVYLFKWIVLHWRGGKYQEVEWQGHMEALVLLFWDVSILFQ